jgi:hypothetical protein
MTKYQWVVFTNCTPGMEAEYNRWYDEEHIPCVFRVKSIVAAQRFRVADWQYLENEITVQSTEEADPQFRYMTIYEIETDNLPAAYRAIWAMNAAGEMGVTAAIDPKDFSAVTFTPVSPRFLNK